MNKLFDTRKYYLLIERSIFKKFLNFCQRKHCGALQQHQMYKTVCGITGNSDDGKKIYKA